MNKSYKITVFTPTYNRAYIIENLYQSLCCQTYRNVEWLVVDDGSSDNTEELFAKWTAEADFPIQYLKKENGGKHTAINMGVELAQGELFFIVDSDDTLPPDSIQTILRWVESLPEDANQQFCGVCGLKAYTMDEVVGGSFSGEWLDCICLEREKYGIRGDKAEVFFTDVLRKYPFPVFAGERFVTEAVVWDRMAYDGYLMRYFNEITYLCDYLDGGLTNQGMGLYFRNPEGCGLYYRQCRKFQKFSPPVQRYYEIQCFLAWYRSMPLRKIAELLDVPIVPLMVQSVFYRTREILSPIKHSLLTKVRRIK